MASVTMSTTRTYSNTCPPLKLRGAPASFQEGTLTITPVLREGSSSFGAEVAGVDWSAPVSEEVVRQVSI
jgi:hypothetical protein